jgi:hypothetical protein
MSAIDKAALFAAIKPKTAEVNVGGFGAVRIAQLSVSEVEAIRGTMKNDEAKKEIGLRFIIRSVVNEDGSQVFADEDIEQLRGASNAAVEELAASVLKLNGLMKDEAAPN